MCWVLIMKDEKFQDNNLSDKLAALNRSIIGIIPYAGPVLSEIICAIIPNQRLDRAIKFLKTIDNKVNELSQIIIEDQNRIRLIETGLKASSNSNFEAKCEWIGNIVNNGLDEKIDISIADEIIQIVEELNLEQIILLYHYCNYRGVALIHSEKFKSRFPELFNIYSFRSVDPEKYQTLQNKKLLNITKLNKSGLIIKELDISNSLSLGSNSYSSGEFELIAKHIQAIQKTLNNINDTEGYQPTSLGQLLISNMMIDEESI